MLSSLLLTPVGGSSRCCCVSLVLSVLVIGTAPVAAAAQLEPEPLQDAITFRNLGPFRAGSWVTDVAAPAPSAGLPFTFYVAARNGGVWKTVNNGTTFTNITDAAGISAVGDIAVARSDSDVLWVGTGDAEMTRSSYSGTGVYRSLDGGATFESRGLDDSHHVARIRIHPEDPNTLWVASMGHLFSANQQRGVFKTTDGGETWQHVLDLGAEVGAVDLVLRPDDPDVLFAAAYDKTRLPWHFEAGGERSGLYRSDDGGTTWSRVAGGFPAGKIGRIGVDICRDQPRVMYAIVENLNLRPPSEEEAESDREENKQPEPRLIGNEVYRSDDGGSSWRRASAEGEAIGSKSAYAFNEIRVDPTNPELVYVTSETLPSSIDGGATWRDLRWPPTELFSKMFGDVRTLWIDPANPRHLLLGSDGGVFPSYDGGKTTDHLLNLPISEVYAVAVDTATPYNIYAGLQDHEAWRGPVDSWSGAVTLEDWVIVGLWDGMYSQIDPDNRYYYGTTQFGNHIRVDLTTGRRRSIEPQAAEGDPKYRFTWTTPIQISPHDPAVLYTGAQQLLRSSDRGDHWQAISPDLTSNDAEKIAGEGHVNYCTITTLAESTLEKGRLWVGTDDGRVWTSSDLGESWDERTAALSSAGAPTDRWVSRVVASRHLPARAWVSKSGYRRDDFRPYLYRTDDYGETWIATTGGLPSAPISVVIEDPVDPDLLFVGNDLGVYMTHDGGQTWAPFQGGMPTVPVRDLVIQQRDSDLVVGTYGRGVWVGDIHPLREISDELLAGRAHLFEIEPRPVQLTERDEWGAYHLYGDRQIEVPNRADGLEIYYYLGQDSVEAAALRIERPSGELLAHIDGATTAGFHKVIWQTSHSLEDPKELAEAASPDGEAAPLEVRPGDVVVVLSVDGQEWTRRTHLEEPPPMPVVP